MIKLVDTKASDLLGGGEFLCSSIYLVLEEVSILQFSKSVFETLKQ